MQKINCNICNSDNSKLLFKNHDRYYSNKDKTFDIVKCNNCGLVYINPQPTPAELADYYPNEYPVYNDGGSRFKYGPISRFLRIFKKTRQPIEETKSTDASVLNYLDFGCAGGHHLTHIKKQHPKWNVEGLDNNSYACQQARKKGFKVYCGDIESITLPGNHYDIIHMSQVIEHLNDPKLTLKILYKTMKIGGVLSITTPNMNSISAKLFGKYWYGLDTPRHLFLFSEDTLVKLLQKTGFKIKKIYYRQDTKYLLTSVYYLLGKKDISIDPIIWRIFVLLNKLFSIRDKKDIIKIEVEKK